MIRLFDIFFSLIGILICIPAFIIVSLFIVIESGFPVIFKQIRVGLSGNEFNIYKFRTMFLGSDIKQQITVGNRDPRITRIGYFLRKSKIDELPQLFNVLKGNMSLVGPRPEVPRYVLKYSALQKRVLDVKPGITDFASIIYRDENELLGKSKNPEQDYIDVVMPRKLRINMFYVDNYNVKTYFFVIFLTIKKVIFRK